MASILQMNKNEFVPLHALEAGTLSPVLLKGKHRVTRAGTDLISLWSRGSPSDLTFGL